MSTKAVVLREYTEGGWLGRMVAGEAVLQVERWLAAVEAKAPCPPGASGKPLAWLYFLDAIPADGQCPKVERAVGLLTDVLRVMDRPISVDERARLREIFDRCGQPFTGKLEGAGLMDNDRTADPVAP